MQLTKAAARELVLIRETAVVMMIPTHRECSLQQGARLKLSDNKF